MSRRSLLIANAKGENSGYVQDNLYCWLDGIDKGASTTTWTDQKGNVSFSGGVSSQNANSVTFNGNSLYTSAINSIFEAPFTMEICYKLNAINNVGFVLGIYPPNAKRGGIKESQIEILGTYTIRQNLSNVAVDTEQTVSLVYDGSNLKIYQNGVLIGTYAMVYGTDSYTLGIASRGSDSRFRVNMNAYSFRIYTKALTADEVASNYAYDVQRFGL